MFRSWSCSSFGSCPRSRALSVHPRGTGPAEGIPQLHRNLGRACRIPDMRCSLQSCPSGDLPHARKHERCPSVPAAPASPATTAREGARWNPGTAQRRRRWWAAGGVAAGLVAGVMAGVASFTGAAPEPTRPGADGAARGAGARPRRASGRPHADQRVRRPGRPGCAGGRREAVVTPAGVRGATSVPGTFRAGVLRVRVPAELVPDGGFSYRFVLQTRDGTEVAYPPGGSTAPIRVLTTRGCRSARSPGSTGTGGARPDGVVVRMPAGAGRGEIGIDGTGEEGGESGAEQLRRDAGRRHPGRRLGERPRPPVHGARRVHGDWSRSRPAIPWTSRRPGTGCS